MLKKIAFILGLSVALLLTLTQIVFLVTLNHVIEDWRIWGAELPARVEFLFETQAWWWSLPVLCAALMVWALRCLSGMRVALTLLVSALGFSVLFVMRYIPDFSDFSHVVS